MWLTAPPASQSNKKISAVMTTTPMMTITVEFMISARGGHATLLHLALDFAQVRPAAWCARSAVFTVLAAAVRASVGWSAPCFAICRLTCRFMPAASVLSPRGDWIRARKVREFEQGRRESNPQPLVLETSALPVELLPFGHGGPGRSRIASQGWRAPRRSGRSPDPASGSSLSGQRRAASRRGAASACGNGRSAARRWRPSATAVPPMAPA